MRAIDLVFVSSWSLIKPSPLAATLEAPAKARPRGPPSFSRTSTHTRRPPSSSGVPADAIVTGPFLTVTLACPNPGDSASPAIANLSNAPGTMHSRNCFDHAQPATSPSSTCLSWSPGRHCPAAFSLSMTSGGSSTRVGSTPRPNAPTRAFQKSLCARPGGRRPPPASDGVHRSGRARRRHRADGESAAEHVGEPSQ